MFPFFNFFLVFTVTTGVIPVPKVHLREVPAASFTVWPQGSPHMQVFPEPITSECTPVTS